MPRSSVPALVGPAGGQEQPLVGRHRVARPRAEPRVAGDRRRARSAWRRRTGRRRARAARRPSSAAPAGAPARGPRSRAAATMSRPAAAAARGAPRQAVTSRRRRWPASAVNRAGSPEVLVGGEPALGLLAGVHAAVPLAARLPAGPGDPVGAARTTKPVGDGARPRGAAVAVALAVRVAPGAQRLSSSVTGPPASSRCTTATRAGRAPSRARAPAPRRRARQRQRGRPSSRSNAARCSCPAGSTVPLGPLVGGRAGPARSPAARRTGSSAASPSMPAPGAVAGGHQQPVVAAGAQPGDRAHRVAAEPVGDQPLARGGRVRGRRTPARPKVILTAPPRRRSRRRQIEVDDAGRSSRSGAWRRGRRRCRRGSTRGTAGVAASPGRSAACRPQP